jgi:ferredoxin--NADP+ reductase
VEQGVVEKESGVALDLARADVFLCGNPEMVKTVKAMLEGRGFKADEPGKPGTIHVEEYW